MNEQNLEQALSAGSITGRDSAGYYNPRPEAITNLEHALSIFDAILKHLLPYGNVVIGGTYALKVHGLAMSRETNDLDVVIYRPTPEQLKFIEMMKFAEVEGRVIPISSSEDQKSYKYKKSDLFCDVLLEEHKEVPHDLLVHRFNGVDYRIQSISNIIAAKLSYIKGDVRLGGYIRGKDIIDLLDLKNSNFNFNVL